jgi:Protein of unknown function (DUF2852)
MTSSTYGTHSRIHSLPLIRPAWTPATIALMVGGFIVFAPAGLAMLAYIIWGERFHAWRENGGSFREAMQSKMDAKMNGRSGSKWYREHRHGRHGFNTTGNMAFDDWRNSELDRLAEERRKLDEMREEFDGYARELRRAKDKEEFDRFMAAREATRDAAPKTRTVPDVKED